jgi:hypothetical protein
MRELGVVMKVKPTGMLWMMPAGWLSRHQQDVIEYLEEENKILREKLGTGILKIRMSLVHGRRQPLPHHQARPLKPTRRFD